MQEQQPPAHGVLRSRFPCLDIDHDLLALLGALLYQLERKVVSFSVDVVFTIAETAVVSLDPMTYGCPGDLEGTRYVRCRLFHGGNVVSEEFKSSS